MLKALGLCLGGRESESSDDKGVQSFDRADEVERLRAELEEAKANNAELERQLLEKSGVSKGSVSEHSVVPANYATLDKEGKPSEDQDPIPFTSEASPKRCLAFAKEKLGKTSVVRLGADIVWDIEFQAGFLARPNDRRSRKGAWSEASYPKLQRANEVIARVEERWCYLGTFAGAGVEKVSYEEWMTFSESIRDGVAAFSGVSRKGGAFEELMRQGRMRVSKYNVRRVGTNVAFRDALVEAGRTPHAGTEGALDESDSSDA